MPNRLGDFYYLLTLKFTTEKGNIMTNKFKFKDPANIRVSFRDAGNELQHMDFEYEDKSGESKVISVLFEDLDDKAKKVQNTFLEAVMPTTVSYSEAMQVMTANENERLKCDGGLTYFVRDNILYKQNDGLPSDRQVSHLVKSQWARVTEDAQTENTQETAETDIPEIYSTEAAIDIMRNERVSMWNMNNTGEYRMIGDPGKEELHWFTHSEEWVRAAKVLPISNKWRRMKSFP